MAKKTNQGISNVLGPKYTRRRRPGRHTKKVNKSKTYKAYKGQGRI